MLPANKGKGLWVINDGLLSTVLFLYFGNMLAKFGQCAPFVKDKSAAKMAAIHLQRPKNSAIKRLLFVMLFKLSGTIL